MSFRDVYIANLEDPSFDGHAPATGSEDVPVPVSPLFPYASRPYFQLLSDLEKGVHFGRQVDAATWIVKMTKVKLLRFIEDSYSGGDAADLVPLLTFVGTLVDDKEYAVVAIEI